MPDWLMDKLIDLLAGIGVYLMMSLFNGLLRAWHRLPPGTAKTARKIFDRFSAIANADSPGSVKWPLRQSGRPFWWPSRAPEEEVTPLDRKRPQAQVTK